MNEVPLITDTSFAFERRLIIVKFNETFVGNRADKGLDDKLSQELSGVFNWALEGLRRVLETGEITESQQMIQDKRDFLSQLNPVKTFVEEE